MAYMFIEVKPIRGYGNCICIHTDDDWLGIIYAGTTDIRTAEQKYRRTTKTVGKHYIKVVRK